MTLLLQLRLYLLQSLHLLLQVTNGCTMLLLQVSQSPIMLFRLHLKVLPQLS